ncbi:MAG: hypothetical protein WCQ77_03095 [Planctomycetota bacterium]
MQPTIPFRWLATKAMVGIWRKPIIRETIVRGVLGVCHELRIL